MPGKKSKKGKREIKLICNPEAGETKDPTARLERVTELLKQQGFKVNVAVAKPKEAAEKIARKAARQGFRTIVVMGGDGTIEAVARALVGRKARLGILPGGTENNIARSLGIPQDIESACRLLKDGRKSKIDAGLVKTQKGKKQYFFEVTAVGLLAALYPDGKDIAQGGWRNIGTVLNEFIHYSVPKMVLKLDGQSDLEVDSLMALVSNTPAFGQNWTVAPDASLDDGLLDIDLFPNISKAELAEYFAALNGGGVSRDTKVERYRARKITLRAKPKQPVMADGIMLGKGKVKIKVKRNALRVIAGKQPTQAEEQAAEITKLPEPVAPAPKQNREAMESPTK